MGVVVSGGRAAACRRATECCRWLCDPPPACGGLPMHLGGTPRAFGRLEGELGGHECGGGLVGARPGGRRRRRRRSAHIHSLTTMAAVLPISSMPLCRVMQDCTGDEGQVGMGGRGWLVCGMAAAVAAVLGKAPWPYARSFPPLQSNAHTD